MKTFTLIFVSLFVWGGLLGQEVTSASKVPTTYDRNSLTVLFLDFPNENHWNVVKPKIQEVVFSDKYDNNNFEALLLKPTFSRSVILVSNIQKAIINDLNINNVGKQIISKWYNRKVDGTMDMDLVHERGRFTATDADYLRAQTSKRGNAALEEFGNRLINRSYILVIDLKDIKTMAEAGTKGMTGWQASVTGYLFRIDFNEQIRNDFYETWVYDEDSKKDRNQKIKAFEKLQIPIETVVLKNLRVVSSQPEGEKGIGILFKSKTNDELLSDLVQKAYDELLYRLETDVTDFKVVTSIFSTKPLRSKIGLKEGLKTDYRFFAYEHVYNSRTNKVSTKRRGVIRASSKSKIVDNRKVATGDTETSKFYQVYGRKLEAGYTIQQRNDKGFEITLGHNTGEIGLGSGRLDIRLGRFVGIRALFMYIDVGFDSKSYPSALNYDIYSGITDPAFTFLRYGAGFAKGYQLSRNVELRPYLGGGIEQAFNKEQSSIEGSSLDDTPRSIFIKPGINLALNLNHNFQIIGGVGTYMFIANAETVNDGQIDKWENIFSNRRGSSTLIGIKIGF
jgi:hypothetical protein